MAETHIIAEASWKELDEDILDVFSSAAAFVVSNEDEYPLMAVEAATLKSASAQYHQDFANWKAFQGASFKEAKDNSKEQLFKAHNEVARKLVQTLGERPTTYLTKPGYRLVKEGGHPKTAQVAAPIVKKADSSRVRGQVHFILKSAKRSEVKGIIGRYSLDGGITWIETIYAFKLNFYVFEMPSGKDVLFQFKFSATNNRQSAWSERVLVGIY